MSKLYAFSIVGYTVSQQSVLSQFHTQTGVILGDTQEYALGAAYKMGQESFPTLNLRVDAVEVKQEFLRAALDEEAA